MLSYKDRAFCPAFDCRCLECDRNTNREDFQPGELLVCYSGFSSSCKKYKEQKEIDMKYSDQVKQLVEAATNLQVSCVLHGAYNPRNLALYGTVADVPHLLVYRDWMERYPDRLRESVHPLTTDDSCKQLATGDYVYRVADNIYVCLRTYTSHRVEDTAAMLCHVGCGEFSPIPYKGAVLEDGATGLESAIEADAAAFNMGAEDGIN